MGIIGLGFLVFVLVIGNIQNFLQGLGSRQLEMSLRRRDVEQWMSHQRLPEDLRRKVRWSECYQWAATRGVNEEMLMENLPEDLQRDIRQHLFKFVKKVQIFAALDEPILDAIYERLRRKTYVNHGTTLYRGGVVTKMMIIVRGKMESMGEDGNKVQLSEGDVCGEELLTWCLGHSSINGDIRNHRKPGYGPLSNRTVKCVTSVEAFVLQAADLEEVISLFPEFLRNHLSPNAISASSSLWGNRFLQHSTDFCSIQQGSKGEIDSGIGEIDSAPVNLEAELGKKREELGSHIDSIVEDRLKPRLETILAEMNMKMQQQAEMNMKIQQAAEMNAKLQQELKEMIASLLPTSSHFTPSSDHSNNH